MSLALTIEVSGDTDLARQLQDLQDVLTDRRSLNESIGITVKDGGTTPGGRDLVGVKRHLLNAATTRHTTANRLGATPTGYINKLAESLELDSSYESARIVATENVDILKRAFGEVEIYIRNRKWLTIPCDARTYGKSPLNFPGMLDFFVIIPDVLAAWRMRTKPKQDMPDRLQKADKPEKPREPGETPKGTEDIVFWGRKSTKLTRDEGLLPTEADFYDLIDLGLNLELQRGLSA